MHHYVNIVYQNPLLGCEPFLVPRVLLGLSVGCFDNGISNGLYLPFGIARADDKVVGHRIVDIFEIEYANILRLFGLHALNNRCSQSIFQVLFLFIIGHLSCFNKSIKLRYTPPPRSQFIGQHIIYEVTCASTNTLAAQYLQKEELPAGTVVITDHQYQGRGQRGNVWYSEPHKNLTFSVVLYPTFLAVPQSFSLNIITALALHQVLAAFVPNDLTAKWPNDIYYQDQKLSGVLIENVVEKQQLKVAVIGIGLNVNQEHFNEQRATSLARICGRTFDLQQVLILLLAALEHSYLQLQTQDVALLRAAYLKNMYWIHEAHTFQDATHKFLGKIRGIDAIGRLVIEHTDSTLKCYDFQEVTFVA